MASSKGKALSAGGHGRAAGTEINPDAKRYDQQPKQQAKKEFHSVRLS